MCPGNVDRGLRGVSGCSFHLIGSCRLRLAHLGPPQEVITSENLRAIYGVDVEVWPVERGSGEGLRVCVPSLAQFSRHGVLSGKSTV